jgi:hypothetical protein
LLPRTDDLNIRLLHRSGSRNTQNGHIQIRQVDIVRLPHPDLAMGKFNTSAVTVIRKAFSNRHPPNDQSNQRKHMPGYSLWEIHPVM